MAECDVSDDDWLAARFEEHRARLNALAYRMLGSRTEAEDTVQDAWLRWRSTDRSAVLDPRQPEVELFRCQVEPEDFLAVYAYAAELAAGRQGSGG